MREIYTHTCVDTQMTFITIVKYAAKNLNGPDKSRDIWNGTFGQYL